MVCSLGSGRMAVMARLLATGNLSQTVAEDFGQQKLAVKNVCRELYDADEANLVDEEDMHVFGLKPMADPLDLVCCNACKKPVKASQYAAHAELCRFVNSAEEMVSQLDCGVVQTKPPRKERKKSLNTSNNQATPVGVQERSDLMDVDDSAASEAQLEGQPGMPTAFSIDVKRNSACIDVKEVSTERTDLSASIMPPPTKRSRLVSSRRIVQSHDPTGGSTKITRTQDSLICNDFQLQSTLRSDMPNDCVVVSNPGRPYEHYLSTRDVLAPLATKIYYSQRNNRLRSAVAHLYHVTSSEGCCGNVVSPEIQESMMQSHASSQRGSSHQQEDDVLNKKLESASHNSDQSLVQRSEVCLDKSGGCLSATNCSNQILVDNTLMPQNAPIGLHRNKYFSKPYPFAGKSGKSLGTMQQANGSVPVI